METYYKQVVDKRGRAWKLNDWVKAGDHRGYIVELFSKDEWAEGVFAAKIRVDKGTRIYRIFNVTLLEK